MATNKDCTKCPYKIAAKFVEPTLKEVQEFATKIGYSPFDSEYFLIKNRSVGWIDNQGRVYRDWQSVVQLWMRGALRRGEIMAGDKPTFRERLNKEMESNDDN